MSYRAHIQEIAEAIRAGPFGEMRALTQLTPDDLRRGAARCDADASFRRRLAVEMETQDVDTISPGHALAIRANRATLVQGAGVAKGERSPKEGDCMTTQTDIITCETVQEEVAHGSADEGGSLRIHVEQCAECRMFAEEVLRQRTNMRTLLSIEPSDGLKAGVESKTWNRGMEIRGVVGMNGYGQLCFFPDSRAEGVPLFDEHGTVAAARLREAIESAPARRFTHTEVAALDPQGEAQGEAHFRRGQLAD